MLCTTTAQHQVRLASARPCTTVMAGIAWRAKEVSVVDQGIDQGTDDLFTDPARRQERPT